jgi:hypothetical protein
MSTERIGERASRWHIICPGSYIIEDRTMKDLWRKLRGGQQSQESEAAPQFPPDIDVELIRLESTYQGRQRARADYPNVDRSGNNMPYDAGEAWQSNPLLLQLAKENYTQGYLDEIVYLDRNDQLHIITTDAQEQGRKHVRATYSTPGALDRTGNRIALSAKNTFVSQHAKSPPHVIEIYVNGYVYGYLDEVSRLDNRSLQLGQQPPP